MRSTRGLRKRPDEAIAAPIRQRSIADRTTNPDPRPSSIAVRPGGYRSYGNAVWLFRDCSSRPRLLGTA